MTHLMENKDGGLYAPDGTLVSLKPNEDAFLREMAGLPTGTEQASAQAEEPKLAAPDASAAAAAGTNTAIVPITSAPTSNPPETAKPLLLDNKPHSLGTEPQLAGEGMFSSTDLDFSLVPAKPENAMTAFLPFRPQDDQSPTPEDDHDRPPAQLPRGPKEFIAKAFERDEPLSQEEFEALQVAYQSVFLLLPSCVCINYVATMLFASIVSVSLSLCCHAHTCSIHFSSSHSSTGRLESRAFKVLCSLDLEFVEQTHLNARSLYGMFH